MLTYKIVRLKKIVLGGNIGVISVDRMAGSIANSIQKNNPDASSFEVLKYGIVAFLNQVIVTSSVLVLGLITGRFIDSLIAVSIFPVLRYFSGGFHLKSSALCNVVTTSFVLLSVYTPVEYWYNGLVLNALALLIILKNAPSGIKRSRIDKKYYPIMKIIAAVIVSSNFIFQSPVLSMIFIIQALTTLRIFYKILEENRL
jgi:accessory gene regulator B